MKDDEMIGANDGGIERLPKRFGTYRYGNATTPLNPSMISGTKFRVNNGIRIQNNQELIDRSRAPGIKLNNKGNTEGVVSSLRQPLSPPETQLHNVVTIDTRSFVTFLNNGSAVI